MERKDSHIALFILLAIIEILIVFFIGWLSVEPTPLVYMTLLGAIFIITIISLILRNINIAVYLLIIFFPIGNILFVLTSPFKIKNIVLTLTPLLDILTVIAILCLLLYKSVAKDRTSTPKETTPLGYVRLLLFIWLAYSILSVLWSPHIIMGLNYCSRLILNFLLYIVLAISLRHQREIIRAIKTLIATALITALASLVSLLPLGKIGELYHITNDLTIHFIFETYMFRASGFSYSQLVAVFLSIGIVFSMGLLSQAKGVKEKSLLFIITIFLLWAILYTKARVPVGSTLLAMIFLIFAIRNFRKHLFRNLFILAISFTILYAIFNVTHVRLFEYSKPFIPVEPLQSEHSLRDRLQYWGKAHNEFVKRDAYLQGVGVGGIRYLLYPIPWVHSIYLSILFDFGLIGFVLFLILICLAITKIFITIRDLKEGFAKAMLLSTLGCIITLGVLSLSDFDYNLSILWLLMGIGEAIYNYAISIQKETVSA